MTIELLECFAPLYSWTGRYVHLLGGYGSGKTLHAVMFMLLKMLRHKSVRFLMVANTRRMARENMYNLAKKAVEELFHMDGMFVFRDATARILCPRTRSEAIIYGCQESYSNLDSGAMRGKKGMAEITDAIFDEVDEIHQAMFDIVDGRCRSPLSGQPNQLVLCYNPPVRTNWIPATYYDGGNILPEFVTPFYYENRNVDMRTGEEVVNRTMAIRTNYMHNKFLPAETAAQYENFKRSNPTEYIRAVMAEWGSNQRGLVFKQENYIEEAAPAGMRGVIYCDPNLAKKGKGDTTGVVRVSTDGKNVYITDAHVENTSDVNVLIKRINSMVDSSHRHLGFDGNVGQESTWTELIRLANAKIFAQPEYRRYRVDDIVKTVQVMWDCGRIRFTPFFSKTAVGKAFLDQLFLFNGKKHTRAEQHDDAPDAMICGIIYLLEKHPYLKWNLLK